MIEFHPGQRQSLRNLVTHRQGTVTASRGFGKTYTACGAALIGLSKLFQRPHLDNKNVFIIGPTWDQTVDIYYPVLAHRFGLERWGNEYKGRFQFQNGVRLQLASYEAIERLRGKGAFMVIADEVTTWKGGVGLKRAWEGIVSPMMTTRHPDEHYSLMITTPCGHDDYYDLTFTEGWFRDHYTYKDAPHLSIEVIEKERRRLDPLTFSREYEASFEESGARVFYAFTEASVEVAREVVHKDLHVAIDFNVGIQAASYWADTEDGVTVCIGETTGAANTYALADQIMEFARKNGFSTVYGYPDPSGKARKTSAPSGVTDHSILAAAGIIIRARRAAPPIVDSAGSVNSRFYHKKAVVLRHCNGVRKSLDRTSWREGNPNSAEIDKTQGVEHHSDGIRYMMDYRWPIKMSTATSSSGWVI